jgi:hypothetical protein
MANATAASATWGSHMKHIKRCFVEHANIKCPILLPHGFSSALNGSVATKAVSSELTGVEAAVRSRGMLLLAACRSAMSDQTGPLSDQTCSSSLQVPVSATSLACPEVYSPHLKVPSSGTTTTYALVGLSRQQTLQLTGVGRRTKVNFMPTLYPRFNHSVSDRAECNHQAMMTPSAARWRQSGQAHHARY